jgi:LysR family transcriptional regulator, glycine cleavage system transcriptional activator
LRTPSLNALRAFVAVARTRSVATAAQELYVTPSAVSHQLKKLEEELGTLLFVRAAKPLRLTPQGQTYFDQLRDAFDQIEAATARVRRQSEDRCVTITTVPVFAIKWLVRRLNQFHAEHPEIEVRLGTSYKSFDLSISGHDLAIRWGSGIWPGLTAVKLMPDVVQPVCSPGFLTLHGAMNPHRVGLAQQLIHMGSTSDAWRLWFSLNGWAYPDHQSAVYLSEPTSAIQAAIDGLGIVLGPRALVDDDIASGRLVLAYPRTVLMPDAYYLVIAPSNQTSHSAQAFADWVCGICAVFAAALPEPDVCILPAQQHR